MSDELQFRLGLKSSLCDVGEYRCTCQEFFQAKDVVKSVYIIEHSFQVKRQKTKDGWVKREIRKSILFFFFVYFTIVWL